MRLPPWPPWPGFHVLVVHFPIALLLVAPLLMVLAMIAPRKWSGMASAAWIVLLLGTVSAWVAVSTGHAAYEETGDMPDAAHQIMVRHGDMGETVRDVFTGICVGYGAVLLAPALFKKLKVGAVRALGTLVVLAVYAWAGVYLANTAHLGGLLVHEYGIQAAVAAEAPHAPGTRAAAQPAAQPAP